MHDAAGQPVGQRLARRVEERRVDDDEPQVVERRRVGAPGDAREHGHDAQARGWWRCATGAPASAPTGPGEHQRAPGHRERGDHGDGPQRVDRRAREGQREQEGTAPLSHSTPLTRPAGPASPGLPSAIVAPRRHQRSQSLHRSTSLPRLRPIARERIISAAPPGTRRSSGRRPSRAASRRRSAGRRRRAGGAAMTSPVWTPPRRMRRARRGAHLAAQAVELLGAQLAGRAARVQAGAPQDLVGQQVADAGTHGLVHEPRLQRRGPAAHARAELVARDLGGVGPEARRGRAPGARGPAGACRAGRAGRRPRSAATKRSQPRGRGLLVDRDAPGHAEVQAEHRPVAGGLDPHRLAAAVRGGQLAADERVGDLAGRVRAADVAVGVVDGDDAPAQRAALDRRPRALSLRQLRHPEQSPAVRGLRAAPASLRRAAAPRPRRRA